MPSSKAGDRFWLLMEVLRTIRHLGTVGGVVLVAYISDLQAALMIDLRLALIIPWVAVALVLWLFRRERRLRRNTVNRENKRNVKLELRLDPNRTSSGLTDVGNGTAGEDEEDSD